MSDPHLPHGVSQSDLDGPCCNICGSYDCDCEDDGDPRSFRERLAEEKSEIRGDYLDRGQ